MKKTKNNLESSPLRVLILEDNPADAELVERELKRARIIFTSRLVEGKREFSKALADFQPQVILADFNLPRFDGLAALEMARLRAPNIPFLFVSGSIGEEKALEMLALGASDYIFKDNLRRLGPAVKRVIEAIRLKLEKKKTDEELRRHVDELQLLAEAADHFVQINDLDEIYEYLAQVSRDLSGADYLLLSLYDEKLEALRPKIVRGFEPFRETMRCRFRIDLMQMVFYFKDMRADDFSDFVSRRLLPVRDGLYGLANGKLPRPHCRAIEKLLAIEAMFTMGFSWENQLYGGLTVLFKKGNELKNHAQVEALLNQAAVAIKRLLAEQALRASEERFRHISATISDISYSCLPDTKGIYSLSWITGATDRISGYTFEEFLAMKCWGKLVLAEDLPDFEKYVTGLTAGNSGICELRLRHKNGNIVWVQSFAECTQNPEQLEQPILYGGLVDISGRKRAEEQIQASLREKEVLLQEIHHRVKNNLQIISGLLTLQADQAAGKSLDEIFQESQDRIRSIALVHEKLYNSHNLAQIAFDEYLRALIENLFISNGVAAGRITTRYEMEPILFTLEKAIPLGLIVNELVTNALKHAFTNGRQGEIRIVLHECRGTASRAPNEETNGQYEKGTARRAHSENSGTTPNKGTARCAPTEQDRIPTDNKGTARCAPTYELTIADNGVGLPAGQVPGQQKTLGMKLVSMLAQQLQAELKVKSGPGTEFRLIFPGLPAKHGIKDNDHAS